MPVRELGGSEQEESENSLAFFLLLPALGTTGKVRTGKISCHCSGCPGPFVWIPS